MESMEAYSRLFQKYRYAVGGLIIVGQIGTCTLPERHTGREIGVEAAMLIVEIMNAVDAHITETTSFKMHRRPLESSSFPYSSCLTLLKATEALVEVVEQHYCGDENKRNFIAVREATKLLAKLALLQNSGYKMLLNYGRETMNNRKDPNDANQQHGHGLHGGLFLMGEFMFIARPVIYILLVRKYGLRSWLPWLVSLSIDLIAMSSSTASLTNHKDQRVSLSKPEKDELKGRKWLLLLYLLRDPFFEKYLRQMLKIVNKRLERVPFTIAKMVSFFAGILLGVQRRYRYISGS